MWLRFAETLVTTLRWLCGRQVLYLLGWLPTGPLLPVGLVFVLLWSLVFLAGAYVGSRARTRWQTRKHQPPRGRA